MVKDFLPQFIHLHLPIFIAFFFFTFIPESALRLTQQAGTQQRAKELGGSP